MKKRPNILLITADQWRGDCLGVVGHPVVQTPNVDAFAKTATVFRNHYAATAPCSPARASLYTGLYQMHHRVIWNGAPLDDRFDNLAKLARRRGYDPTLFGYTDTAPDPRSRSPRDPALLTYEGVLPGFSVRQYLPEDDKPWISWLASRGYGADDLADVHKVAEEDGEVISRKPARYSKEETQTAFLTDCFLNWMGEQADDTPWMAHISYLRPHPPLSAPAPYNEMYAADQNIPFEGGVDPDDEAGFHPLIEALQGSQFLKSHIPGADGLVRDLRVKDLARLRALYYGMISEVDTQLGRVFDGLKAASAFENTLIVFTSDHAEMMGDHWMLGKGGFYRQSYHIPLMIHSPGAEPGVISAFTSATDIFPTLAEILNVAPGHTPDGASLVPFLAGRSPASWRTAAVWEYDYRNQRVQPERPEDGQAQSKSVISLFDGTWQYVHAPGLPNILWKPRDQNGALQNFSGQEGYRDIEMNYLQELVSLRMRLNDETLAQKLVWEYAETDF